MVGAWGWLEWRVRLECGGCAIPNRFVRVILTGGACPAVLRRRLLKDGELPAAEMDCGHAEALRLAGQWGHVFPKSLVDGVFEVVAWPAHAQRHFILALRMRGPWHASARSISVAGTQCPASRAPFAYGWSATTT
ncbi:MULTISPECIES: hypothetical protein [Stenotrophomonas]|uniref:hypothetical protein n=1 Tax=Stenotrophomonas TaxID=40323 RepID=UPI000AF58F0B|nr:MULTISPECIES: hypothetical protein [Stenotrophomonas]